MLRATIAVCGVLLGLLLAAIGMATGHESVIIGLQRMLADPWGIVTLLDLSIGLLFVAAWICVMEPRPLFAVGWIIALCMLGNTVTLIFLLLRTRHVHRFRDLFLPSHHSDPTA